jgi:molecular chaperone GrpE
MSDKEHEIPVKVVDRRWWANAGAASSTEPATSSSLKPTYVEQLEQQVAEKDKQVQEYIAKYRQAAGEFEEARLRLRREISKDIERARRDVLSEMLEVVDNLDRAIEAGRRFDPTIHEAITTLPASSPELDGTVVGVVRRGYRIGDEVLRPAAVAVAKHE